MKLRSLGFEGWMTLLTGLAAIIIGLLDFIPAVSNKIPIDSKVLLIALGLLLAAAATQVARRKDGETALQLEFTKIREAIREAFGAAPEVQSDRSSNYKRGADLLYGVSAGDKIVLSFLEDSRMWE